MICSSSFPVWNVTIETQEGDLCHANPEDIHRERERETGGNCDTFDDCSQYEVVENIRAVPPRIRTPIFLHTFVIESVYLCYLSTLMVSPQQGYLIRVPSLQTQQQLEGLHTIIPPINIVSHEDVIILRNLFLYVLKGERERENGTIHSLRMYRQW